MMLRPGGSDDVPAPCMQTESSSSVERARRYETVDSFWEMTPKFWERSDDNTTTTGTKARLGTMTYHNTARTEDQAGFYRPRETLIQEDHRTPQGENLAAARLGVKN